MDIIQDLTSGLSSLRSMGQVKIKFLFQSTLKIFQKGKNEMSSKILQGLTQCISVWDEEGFAKWLQTAKAECPRGNPDYPHHVPLPILNAMERANMDFTSKSGGHFKLIPVPDYKYPWALDMLWVINLLGVPVLMSRVWDCEPCEGERLPIVFAADIA